MDITNVMRDRYAAWVMAFLPLALCAVILFMVM
jgi:hypothetical protein